MKASCQCGQLQADVQEGHPPLTIACHCSSCQKRTGSPFGVIAYFPVDAVSVIGNAKEFTRQTDTGSTFTTGFCPTCGSTVYANAESFPEITGVAVGTLANPSFAQPTLSVYEESRHDWVVLPSGTPGFAQRPDAG